MVLNHTVDTEPRDGASMDDQTVQPYSRADGVDRRLDVASQVPGHALVNHLGHRAAPVGDDRGAARHSLHDGQAERLVEVDRVQQRSRVAEDIRAALRADRAEEDDLIPVDWASSA